MNRVLPLLAFLLVFPLLTSATHADTDIPPPAEPNGLALTPPMGWNTWNKFGCNISESLIKAAADSLVASGMKDAGYQYVLMDDCWHGARNAAGDIAPDPTRFPHGIKALADYVHGKGLKLGIYSDAGDKTCGGKPGSRGHEFQDALRYAAWGIDYLKYDWCHTSTQDAPSSYRTMADALRATGRPIVFSLCEWGNAKPWNWGAAIGGNLWRTSGDIWDKWQGKGEYQLGVMDILDKVAELYPYAGPGHWNDPDMLEVGNGGMTDTEYRAHFSLWAEMAAPLIAGNDLTAMTPATKAILTNRAVIAVDQDRLGAQGRRVAKSGDLEVWSKPLADGGRAVVLLNRGTTVNRITADWTALGYPAHLTAKIRDLWTGQDLAPATGGFAADVEPHGVVMVTITP